jgi:hypothetical protein
VIVQGAAQGLVGHHALFAGGPVHPQQPHQPHQTKEDEGRGIFHVQS